ncbi:hypothetical protein [Mycolicibacterium psychrotolerans]|uniref:Aminopeptidase n=1 Tax=Mycolicibacterium psychrotolerans TaxID=216929 RepID=A0A7I7MEU8_9MYCO|nr:hypothetical protein [Mycolicibacterium psychrotolerans]BBX70718.1 hypothetical protein MPSYJ_41790 [Mycolicibacterium psychrotolerans]
MGTDLDMILRRIIMLICAVAAVIGIAGLLTPVSVSPQRQVISCGTAVAPDLSQARIQEAPVTQNARQDGDLVVRPDYTALCRQELDDRRLGTLSLAAVGALAVIVALSMELRQRRRHADA